MSKMLEEILKEDSESRPVYEQENEVLEPLLEEIDMIKDQSVRYFVRSVLLRCDTFWTIPSSFSGRFHPPDERGEGGNVLHTKRVVRLVSILCESYASEALDRDILIAAAILHDITKGMKWEEDSEPRFDPMHPYTVDRLVRYVIEDDRVHAAENQSSSIGIEAKTVESILRAVRCHMGMWSPIPETYPITKQDIILHVADHVAAKLHEIIDGKDIQYWRWDEPNGTGGAVS